MAIVLLCPCDPRLQTERQERDIGGRKASNLELEARPAVGTEWVQTDAPKAKESRRRSPGGLSLVAPQPQALGSRSWADPTPPPPQLLQGGDSSRKPRELGHLPRMAHLLLASSRAPRPQVLGSPVCPPATVRRTLSQAAGAGHAPVAALCGLRPAGADRGSRLSVPGGSGGAGTTCRCGSSAPASCGGTCRCPARRPSTRRRRRP